MTAWLKIENPGVAPAESFTLLGASTKRDNNNSRNIGRFGSGNKHAAAVLLRNNLNPVIFAGNLKLEFGTRSQTVNTGIKQHEFARVVVKYGGKDADGSNRSSTEDLGFVLEYGAADWLGVDLALREFVSNSLDRAEEEADHNFQLQWIEKHKHEYNGEWNLEQKNQFKQDIETFRKTSKPWENVIIEIVNDNQVRAKNGTTRVFVPLSNDVLNFFNNLGKWFLHFSEPELLNQTILPKMNRNLTDQKTAVIYRRGVRVREFESSKIPSLFDYNLEQLELDESRKVDDWYVQHYAGKALADAKPYVLAKVMQSFLDNQNYWEHSFSQGSLEPNSWDKSETLAARSKNWQEAFESIAGQNGVIATKDGGKMAAKKGFNIVSAPDSFVNAAGLYNVKTPNKVLTNDDRAGRIIQDATIDAITAVDFVWDIIQTNNLTNNRSKPKVASFTKIMDAGSQVLGFYRDDTVFINTDIASNSGVPPESLSQQLLVTALEEVAHHVTKAADFSRDLQDYVLNLAMIVMRAQANHINQLMETVDKVLG